MIEPSFNQYAAPVAEVADVGQPATGELRMFSSEGRIGRLRYLAYGTGSGIVYNILSIPVAMLGIASPALMGILLLAMYVPLLWFTAITGIKRCHDIGISGWWTLTMIIPIIALLWIFWPGNKEANAYGAPPPPNTLGVRLLGLILPVVFFVGILAAVAIPQYKSYTDRTKAAAQHQQP